MSNSSNSSEPLRPPEDYVARIRYAAEALDAARAERDDEIRRLNAAGVTMYRLAKWFDISQQAVAKIVRA